MFNLSIVKDRRLVKGRDLETGKTFLAVYENEDYTETREVPEGKLIPTALAMIKEYDLEIPRWLERRLER